MAYEISPDAQAVINQAGQGAMEYVQGLSGFGNKLTSGEATRALSNFKATPTVGQQVQTGIAQLGSQQYQFDPNQYLPAIQGQAESIYSPQQAQLEAIRQLQQASYQDVKVQTEKDFQKRLQQEVEAVNARGAFFSGGAVQNEQDIRSSQQSAQTQLALQFAAGQYGNYAQQAALAAEKTQFIQDRLVNAESSAYARWTDQRNFSLQALQTQYSVYANERDFARSVFESDRTFEQQQKQFEQTYDITSEQFKMAKQEFNIDMKIKGLSYDQALKKFKESTANKNTGVLGTDEYGNDIEQGSWDDWQKTHTNSTVTLAPGTSAPSGGIYQGADGTIMYPNGNKVKIAF
jgi:hypothetical protein